MGSGCLTAKNPLIFQSLIFLICKMQPGCSFCRDEIYQRYRKYPTHSRHSVNASSSFLFRGILSVSWSQADAELLLSSAKDNQVLCWNLGSSEVGWPSCGCAGMGGEMDGRGTQQQLCVLGRLTYVRVSLMVCSLILGGI